MPSSIDATKPEAVAASTSDVRLNFAYAKAEIEALQAAVAAIEAELEDPSMDGTAPISLVAGNSSASALQDISAASGSKVMVATEGPIRVRFGAVPVTESVFDLFCPAGTTGPYSIAASVDQCSAWGDGGAWKYNIKLAS